MTGVDKLGTGGTVFGYPASGYIVSIAPLGEISPSGVCKLYSDESRRFESVQQFFSELERLYHQTYDSVGYWWSESGYYCVDGNIHVDSLDEALAIGRKYCQEAIWDVQNENAIYL